nr:hypothetical protein [Nanoarchaeota archaeon]
MLLTYIILLIIIFLGLLIGLLIGYMAKEELKPGKKYFDILRHALFIAILVVFFVKNPSVVFIIFIAALVIIFSFSKHRETLYYYTLAVIFFLSWHYNGFALLAPLIFLYGLPVGSIYLHNHIKKKKKQVILGLLYRYAGFLILGIILGLLGLVL